MRAFMNRLALPCLLTALLIPALPACDDDDSPAVPVGISGQVVDADGAPVGDVAIGLIYSLEGVALPGDWDKGVIRPFDKPATQIQFVIPEAGYVQLWVEDYAGRTVRTLLDGMVDAGTFTVAWDSLDDDGQHVPAGIYNYFLAATGQESQGGQIFLYLHEDTEILLAPHAVTDAEGRFWVPGNLIPVGATIDITDVYGTVTGTATVRSAILVRAVVADDVAKSGVSLEIDWTPGERLGGLVLTL